MKRIVLALSVLVLLSGCAGMGGFFDTKGGPPSAPPYRLTDAEIAAGTATTPGLITAKQYTDNLVAGSGDMTKAVYDADDDGSVDGQDAEEVSVIDAGGLTGQTTVEAYLAENRTAINLNTAKETNVSTNLSEGTATETTVDVNSSDGTNATLASASTSRAGLLTKAKFDEIVANTAKVSDTFTAATGANVGAKFSGVGTYLKADGSTGDPTGGADAAAIHDNVAAEISVITGKTTPADADVYLVEDSADSYNKKSVTIANLWANSFKAKADALYATLTNLPGSWASPGAAIGSGTPVAVTATTIGAGGGGFSVDADGDVTYKSAAAAKQSGVAGDYGLYEANSTDTHDAGRRGPDSITGDGAYRGKYANARASSANMVEAWTNVGETGTGTAADPYVQTVSFVDLDNYALIESINTAAELEAVANLGAYASDILAATDEANLKSIANLERPDLSIMDTTGTFATPITTNPYSLAAANCYGGTLFYGATGEVDLPAGVDGMNIIVYNTGAFTVTIDPNGTEVITREGTAQTGGVSITLSSGAGNFVALVFDGVQWITLGKVGTLAEGT